MIIFHLSTRTKESVGIISYVSKDTSEFNDSKTSKNLKYKKNDDY